MFFEFFFVFCLITVCFLHLRIFYGSCKCFLSLSVQSARCCFYCIVSVLINKIFIHSFIHSFILISCCRKLLFSDIIIIILSLVVGHNSSHCATKRQCIYRRILRLSSYRRRSCLYLSINMYINFLVDNAR